MKQGAGAVVDKTKQTINKLPPGAKGGLAVAGTAAALIGAKDIIDGAKDLVSGGDKKVMMVIKKVMMIRKPSKYVPVVTTPDAAGTGPKWRQSYEKAAPYHSSKRYYRNIRN